MRTSACLLLLAACGSNDLTPIVGADSAEGGAPSPSSSSTSSSAGGSSGTSGSSGSSGAPTTPTSKRGLAYGYNSDDDLAVLSPGIGWWYNWAAKPDDTLSKSYAALNIEYVPMVWGGTFDAATLEKQIPQGTKYLLTFNEPNFGAQSNLTPDAAAALWPQIQAFAKTRNMAIVSPALNYCGGNCNDTDPFDWLTKFFAACTDCQVDYVAMHWYACDKSSLVSTLGKYEAFGKPVWVTEFSCMDDKSKVNDADELAYMKDAVAALEADPKVFRYAWFTGRSTGTPSVSVLGTDSGTLTPLGQAYLTQPH